jgi:hypothetical protein
MRHIISLIVIGLVISLSSCRKDFDFKASSGDLRFSRDTVYLDTVFTNIGSSTYTLKVYNRSNDDINIPVIQLGRGLSSKYRMTVDGMQGNEGKIFSNVELLRKDSLYIFIEVTADVASANPDDFLYTDQILFDVGSKQQKVELVTLIQDAIFLYPQRDDDGVYETIPIGIDQNGEEVREKGFLLEADELNWTNEKPYVIYGFAGIPAGESLNVGPGTRVHFHDGSGLIAYNGATLNINGEPSLTPALENEVIFEGDRLEPGFSDVAGQWLTIWMTQGSKANLNNFTLKNSVIGLMVSGNDGSDYSINMHNVQIYNSSNYGIRAYTGRIKGENVVIGSAGAASFAGLYGGKYNFTHSTFYNDWPSSSQVAVGLSDNLQGAEPATMALEEATFNNCIIWGSNPVEMILNKVGDNFNYQFNHTLIRFNNINNQFTNNPLYQFATDATHYDNVYIATNSTQFRPRFWNTNTNNFRITEESEAIGKGDPDFTISHDVLNVPRILNPGPDLGAYQNAPIPE